MWVTHGVEKSFPGSGQQPCLSRAPQGPPPLELGGLPSRAALAFRASEGTAEFIGRLRVAVQRWVCNDQTWLCCPHSPQFLQ